MGIDMQYPNLLTFNRHIQKVVVRGVWGGACYVTPDLSHENRGSQSETAKSIIDEMRDGEETRHVDRRSSNLQAS